VASKTKMALSKMSSKVKNREYSGGLIEFSDDVEFIVRNCNPVFYTVYELIGIVCGRRCTMTRM
jgi:hypothetical protein